MPRDDFLQRKESLLTKDDKSFKGSWDSRIRDLCLRINRAPHYYTTSSCSGRLMLLKDEETKSKDLFLWVTHDECSIEDFLQGVSEATTSSQVKCKVEPPILHVACRALEDAEQLLSLALQAGFKRSGLLSFGDRLILEINGTDRLEFPLIVSGQLLTSEDFLREIHLQAMEKLQKGWKKIDRLLLLLQGASPFLKV